MSTVLTLQMTICHLQSENEIFSFAPTSNLKYPPKSQTLVNLSIKKPPGVLLTLQTADAQQIPGLSIKAPLRPFMIAYPRRGVKRERKVLHNGTEKRKGERDHPQENCHPLGEGIHLLGGPDHHGPGPWNRQTDPAVFHRQDPKGGPGEDASGGGGRQ